MGTAPLLLLQVEPPITLTVRLHRGLGDFEVTFGCSGIFPLEFPGLSLFFPEHFGKILPGIEEQMLICIYACFWALMRLGGAFLIKASSEAGPCEADWGGKRKCHTVRRVWAREKGALEPSLSYELRGYLWVEDRGSEVRQAVPLLSKKHWTSPIPPRVSAPCLKWKLTCPAGLPNFSRLSWD